ALRRDPIPRTPSFDVVRLVAAYDEGGGRESALPGKSEPRRVSGLRPAIVGVLAVGGAAFAALGLLSTARDDGRVDAPGEIAAPNSRGPVIDSAPAYAASRSLIDYVDEAES